MWRCLGSYTDAAVTTDDADCTTGLGVCGETQYACAQGTSVGTSNTWTCYGPRPASFVTVDNYVCSIPICEDQKGTCEVGAPIGSGNPWRCEGDGPGNVEISCEVGVCNHSSQGQCHLGTPVGSGDEWVCEGSDDMSTADDTECVIAECGQQDNELWGCETGEWEEVVGPSWACLGFASGGTDVTCP